MSNEIPPYLKKLIEAHEASKAEETRLTAEASKPAKKDAPLPKKKPALQTPVFNPFQLAILSILGLLLCGICAGTVGILYTHRTTLLNSPAPSLAAAPTLSIPEGTGISEPATPTPAPSSTVTPTAQPTAVVEPSATATYVVAPEFINKDKINEITQFVEQHRQLSLPEGIPIKFLTRHQLRDQWRDEAFDVAALKAVQTQQEFYTVLGLIEPKVDLVQAAFDAQTNILLGYYTPKEKAMYIIADSVNMFAEEEMTFAHEYVHALQDYHFDLTTIFNDETSGDSLLAARSLPEGDARLVENLFTKANIGQDQIEYSIYRYLFQAPPELEGVSPALGIFTYFPYTAGQYFVTYLFIAGDYSWDQVNAAYRRPPVSTEQVMHPEKYLAGEMPVPVSLPDLAPVLDSTWHEIDRDVLGEAGFLVWLIDQVEATVAGQAAAGWAGDSYTLWVDETNHRLLVESSLWETEAEAVEFVEGFSTYMNLREGEASRFEEAGARLWGYDEGLTWLSRRGSQVLIIIAPDRTTVDQIRKQFGDF